MSQSPGAEKEKSFVSIVKKKYYYYCQHCASCIKKRVEIEIGFLALSSFRTHKTFYYF